MQARIHSIPFHSSGIWYGMAWHGIHRPNAGCVSVEHSNLIHTRLYCSNQQRQHGWTTQTNSNENYVEWLGCFKYIQTHTSGVKCMNTTRMEYNERVVHTCISSTFFWWVFHKSIQNQLLWNSTGFRSLVCRCRRNRHRHRFDTIFFLFSLPYSWYSDKFETKMKRAFEVSIGK